MAQTMLLNKEGFGDIKLGTKLSALTNVESVDNHPRRDRIRLSFDDEYSYYYINDSTLRLDSIGRVNDLFVVPNSSGDIIAVICYVAANGDLLEREISKVFGSPSLASNSTIEGNNFNSKVFWKSLAGMNIFLTNYPSTFISKIGIYALHIDEHTPGVVISLK